MGMSFRLNSGDDGTTQGTEKCQQQNVNFVSRCAQLSLLACSAKLVSG